MTKFTPVEKHGNFYIKRDDLFSVYGATGAKARNVINIIKSKQKEGVKHFVTAGSRQSAQCRIVSTICNTLGLRCTVFMPRGADTKTIKAIRTHEKTKLIRVNAGYNNVLASNAKRFCGLHFDTFYIPFGMEFMDAVLTTAEQVKNIPMDVTTIIVPVGSGINFCGIAHGIEKLNRKIHLVGITVGKDPKNILEKYLPPFFNSYTLIKSQVDYGTEVDYTVCGIELDKIYEAKCGSVISNYIKNAVPFCFWIVGKNT